MPPENIALQILEESGETVEDFEGLCGELADEVLHRYPNGKILYLEPVDSEGSIAGRWSYHMVAIVDGLVHDAWFPELVLCPKEYVSNAFPGERISMKVYS